MCRHDAPLISKTAKKKASIITEVVRRPAENNRRFVIRWRLNLDSRLRGKTIGAAKRILCSQFLRAKQNPKRGMRVRTMLLASLNRVASESLRARHAPH